MGHSMSNKWCQEPVYNGLTMISNFLTRYSPALLLPSCASPEQSQSKRSVCKCIKCKKLVIPFWFSFPFFGFSMPRNLYTTSSTCGMKTVRIFGLTTWSTILSTPISRKPDLCDKIKMCQASRNPTNHVLFICHITKFQLYKSKTKLSLVFN